MHITRDDTIRAQILSSVDTATYMGIQLLSDFTWNKKVKKGDSKNYKKPQLNKKNWHHILLKGHNGSL